METVGWAKTRRNKFDSPMTGQKGKCDMSKLCAVCGTEIPEGEEFEMDGQVLCKEHFDELYAECADCGAIVRRDTMTTVHGGWLVCEDCLDSDYTACEDCGEYYPSGDVYEVNSLRWAWDATRGYHRTGGTMFVCTDCLDDYDKYFQCADCGTWNIIERRELCDDDIQICVDCADGWHVCTECGAVIRDSSTYWDENDDPYCRTCYNEVARGAIHEYGYKPDPVFGTTDSRDGSWSYNGTDFTFGVELECDKGDDPRDAAREIQDLTDRVYCKHDGSLDDGYEIVTMPGTLDWHMKKFPWKEIVQVSLDHRFTSHDARTCGLHIHIGRAQFGENWARATDAVSRLILLTNAVWPELCHFSRRNGDMHWAHMNEGFSVIRAGMTDTAAYTAVRRQAERQGRYVAVNVQNDATVELRFNRGTLKLRTIYACLQLANNLALFAKDHTLDECVRASWDDVVHYREYEELNAYVAERFRTYNPGAVDRPTTSFRSGAEATVDASVNATYNLLMDDQAELEPAGTVAVPGDLIVLADRTFDSLGAHGPGVGAFGTCITEGCFLFNDHENIMFNQVRDFPTNRHWYTPSEYYRVIRRMRNGVEVPSHETLLALARAGYTIGDPIMYDGYHGVIASAVKRIGGNTSVLLHLDGFDGHDGDMFDDCNAWWTDVDFIEPID